MSSLMLGFPEAVLETRTRKQGIDLGGDSRKQNQGGGKRDRLGKRSLTGTLEGELVLKATGAQFH